jgi:transposase InsO family protein
MRKAGLQGVRRGKSVPTTTPDSSVPCPLDRVNRVFKADRPNQLWVSDFTYVNTWQGWLYVAFVIDVFALRIMGWRVSRNMQTDFVLDVLEPALYDRRPAANDLIHHSDRGSQYVSIRYTERLDQAGIKPSVGSKGDSYDNALAETINGLYKAGLIHRRGPWKTGNPWNCPPCYGCTGSTTSDFSNRLEVSLRQKLRQTTGSSLLLPAPRQRYQLNPTSLHETRGCSPKLE